MPHGGAAMLTLMVLGALVPLHIGRAWRAKKIRATGSVTLAFNAVLIATTFRLHYLAPKFCGHGQAAFLSPSAYGLPLLFLGHIKTGRKRA
ncbi:MAG: hypothetical protein ACRECP_05350 [Methylocella sp.]